MIPGPDKSNVVVLARAWQRRARWRRPTAGNGSRFGFTLSLFVLAACVAVLACVSAWRNGIALSVAMLNCPMALVGVCATPLCYLVMRSRRRQKREFSNSFLIALPVSERQVNRAIATSLALKVGLIALALSVPVCLALLSGGSDVRAWVTLLICVWFGVVGGGVLGWRLAFAPRRARSIPAGNGLRWQPRFARRDGMSALSHWPMLQARRGTNPAFHARVLLPALLTMPTGIPLWVTVALLASLIALFAAHEWLHAWRLVLPAALRWLSVLPMTRETLAWRVSIRCAAWFAAGIVGASALLVAIGLPAAPVVVVALGILAGFILAGTLACRTIPA